MRSLMLGRFWITSRTIVVAAPVRAELKTSEVWAVTVTSSVMAAWVSLSCEVGRDAQADDHVLRGLRLEAAEASP